MKSKEFLKDVITLAYKDMAIQALSFRHPKPLQLVISLGVVCFHFETSTRKEFLCQS